MTLCMMVTMMITTITGVDEYLDDDAAANDDDHDDHDDGDGDGDYEMFMLIIITYPSILTTTSITAHIFWQLQP